MQVSVPRTLDIPALSWRGWGAMTHNDDGSRTILGVSFDPKVSTGTLLVIACQAVAMAFFAGIIWFPVSTAPAQLTELRGTVTSGFAEVSKDLNALRLQTAAIADLNAREHELAARQTDVEKVVGELRADMSGMKADVTNIKNASQCLPGDRRSECRARN